jgi:FOG: TPR repeat, SEL1 subfamily
MGTKLRESMRRLPSLALLAVLAVPVDPDAVASRLGGHSTDTPIIRVAGLDSWLTQRDPNEPERAQPADSLPKPDGNAALPPSLSVAALPGKAGHPTPLAIDVVPPPVQPGAVQEPLTFVLISQVPAAAEMSRGLDLGNGTWEVQLEGLRDLTITTPPGTGPTLTLTVTAVTDYGKNVVAKRETDLAVPIADTAASAPKGPAPVTSSVSVPASTMTVATAAAPPAPKPPASVEPARTVPETAPARTSNVPERQLLKRGDDLFAQGDLAGARLYYEMAAGAGSGQGALAAGGTYDPRVHEQLHVRGLAASPEQAAAWYRRAKERGNGEAEARLSALSAWLARQRN